MKKIGLVFSLVLFFSATFQINAQWFWQNPLNQEYNFNDSYFVNETIGWIVGNDGIIMRTNDGGLNWEIQMNQYSDDFNSVFFIDSLIGFVAGAGYNFDGKIYKSTDGGINWLSLSIPTVLSLTSIYFLDLNVGFAVGYDGAILKTTNGGSVWRFVSNGPIGNHLYDIEFSDSSNGVVISHYSKLGFTSDGGETWHFNYLNPSHGFMTLALISSNSIIVAGDRIILKSTDGGIIWHSFNTPYYINSLCFIDSLVGFAVGYNGVVLKTVDGGYSWTLISYGEMKTLARITKTNSNTLIVVGSSSTVKKSLDLGGTWISMMNDLFDNISSVFFADSLTGYITGRSRLLKTTDGGLNWNSLTFGLNNDLNDVYMRDDDNIYFVGDEGIIGFTNNSGQDWEVNQLNNEDLSGVFFTSNLNGIIISESGKILRTSNAGSTWDTVYQNIVDYTLNGIDFLDDLNGVVVGGWFNGSNQQSIILITNDGGKTWQERSVAFYLRDVQFLDNNKIIAVGSQEIPVYKGIIMVTIDGGNTWSTKYNNNSLFDGCYFFDLQNGFVTDWEQGGSIKKTSDGGITWEIQHQNSDWLLDIYFVDNNYGWAVGSKGTILHTTNSGVTFIEEENNPAQPKQFLLQQNYPNPFNPSTKISWQVPVSGWQTLKVYDILGNEVATLFDEYRIAGSYEVEFQSSVGSHQLANGVYFYQLRVGDFVETKKMVILK